MKKIININLSSRLIPIEDTAYELLKNYLDSLRRHFAGEEGGDEIVSDIESRIAEVFQEKLKKGAHCITDDDVNAMIASMGRPEQLEDEPQPAAGKSAAGGQPGAGQATGQQSWTPPAGKRLMRNENDKVLGGVCSGFANYLGIDPVVARILFVLFTLAWGAGILIYIILWVLLPGSSSIKSPISKRLYRNPDNKVLGGVCSGLASYFNTDAVIVRIIFILPLLGMIFFSILGNWFWFHHVFFAFSLGSFPTLILIYVILWISVPKAVTVAEKLEMRGEKVDLQNITNAVKGGLGEEKKTDDGGLKGTEEAGPSAAAATSATPASAPSPVFLPPPPPVKKRVSFGDVILLLLKIAAFFILAVILIVLCGALIGLAGAFIGTAGVSSMAFPLRGFLLNSPLQHVLAWPAVFLTLGIPVVAIIWFFIKLVTGFKTRTKYVGATLGILWLIGVICAISLAVSLAKDFRMSYRESSAVQMIQPSKGKLIIRRANDNISIGGWNVFDHVLKVADDTIIINNVRLQLEKSQDDSFRVELVKASNGRSVGEARAFAEGVNYNISQQDSILYLQQGFSIPRGNPFRNQRIILKVYVPVGKNVMVDDNINFIRWNSHRWWSNSDDWGNDWDNDNEWEADTNYKMTKDGLKEIGDSSAVLPPPEAPRPPDEMRKDRRHRPTENKTPEDSSGASGSGGNNTTVISDALSFMGYAAAYLMK